MKIGVVMDRVNISSSKSGMIFLRKLAKNMEWEKVKGENDHGSISLTQLRMILPVIVFLYCFSSFPMLAQTEFDVPDSIFVEKYTHADTSYVNARIKILDDILKAEGHKPKDSLALKYYNELYTFKGLKKPNLLELLFDFGIKKRQRESMISTVEYRKRTYENVLAEAYNTDNSHIHLGNYYNRRECYDSIPLVRGLVKVPYLSWREDDWNESNGDYCSICYLHDYRYHIRGERKVYPVKYIYNKSYPDCAFVEDGLTYLVYDLEGNLKRCIVPCYHTYYYEELNAFKLWCYMKDFAENRYNIKSQDAEVVQAVEIILRNDPDSEYEKKIMAVQMLTFLGTLVAKDAKELQGVSDVVNDEICNATMDYLNAISEKKAKLARSYVEQLKCDHSNEFKDGRTKRIDDTSYYQSFVDVDGKCTHLMKIEYIQTAPFESERKVTFIK